MVIRELKERCRAKENLLKFKREVFRRGAEGSKGKPTFFRGKYKRGEAALLDGRGLKGRLLGL